MKEVDIIIRSKEDYKALGRVVESLNFSYSNEYTSIESHLDNFDNHIRVCFFYMDGMFGCNFCNDDCSECNSVAYCENTNVLSFDELREWIEAKKFGLL